MSKSKIIMDGILQECVERAYEEARLGRDDENRDREICGDAMRYIKRGLIAWKATPQLRDKIQDLLIDAIAEQREEAI